MEVLIFGATGNIGSEVVRCLAEQPDVQVRVATRDVARARAAFVKLPSVKPVLLDWRTPQTIDDALSGASRLCIINSLSPEMAALTAALTARARRAKVELVLRFSLMGAGEPEPIEEARWHDAADQAVRDGGPPWVLLKPNQYFQNFMSANTLSSVRVQGVMYFPYADSRVSSIDTRDLGEIAARVLLSEYKMHAGKEYVLTGPAAHTMDELAQAIGAEIGKEVRYVAVPEDAARKDMLKAGMQPAIVEAILGWFAYCRAGRAERVEPAAAKLLGRPPRRIKDFARIFAHAYKI